MNIEDAKQALRDRFNPAEHRLPTNDERWEQLGITEQTDDRRNRELLSARDWFITLFDAEDQALQYLEAVQVRGLARHGTSMAGWLITTYRNNQQ